MKTKKWKIVVVAGPVVSVVNSERSGELSNRDFGAVRIRENV
jgi:hypothetical protein